MFSRYGFQISLKPFVIIIIIIIIIIISTFATRVIVLFLRPSLTLHCCRELQNTAFNDSYVLLAWYGRNVDKVDKGEPTAS